MSLSAVSRRWLVAQRCLSALGTQRLALCAGSQRCGDMLSAGSQCLVLALDDVSWHWLVAQNCLSALGSQRLALCAGSQSLALALDDVSRRWLVAQRCLSALTPSALISSSNLTINYDINYDDVSGIDTEW